MYTDNKDTKMNMPKDSLGTQAGRLADGLGDSLSHFGSDMRNTASAMKDDVEGAARRTGQHVRELADSATHSLSDVGGVMTLRIRNNPVQSSLIALGIGAILGMLYRR